jgi:hypothetical protein
MLQHDRAAVRRAIILGSIALLALQVGWSALGIALVPFEAAAGLRADPVSVILGAGSSLAPVTTVVAACAISTTILGTALALKTFFADALPTERGEKRPAMAAYVAAIGLPAAAAATSQTAFFSSIDLAGAYPVALLWLLAPPLMALRLQHKRDNDAKGVSNDAKQDDEAAPYDLAVDDCQGPQETRSYMRTFRRAWLILMAGLAAAFLGSNAVTDLSALLAGAKARWQ